MANTVNINDLDTLSPSALNGDYYGIVFDAAGDTNKVVFEDAVSQANSNNGCVCIQETSVVITSAEMLNLFTTPKEIIPAQGAGTIIEPISVIGKMYNNTLLGSFFKFLSARFKDYFLLSKRGV